MANPFPDPERIIRILVDAVECGDQVACDRWGVTTRTLRRYREKMTADPRLSEAVISKSRQLDGEWRTARRVFLRSAIAKLQALIEGAGEERIREIAGAIKIVGDLEVVSGALAEGAGNGNISEPTSSSAPSEGDAGDAARVRDRSKLWALAGS